MVDVQRWSTCNVYPSAQLAQVVNGTISITDFDKGAGSGPSGYVCDLSKLDANWCPGSRIGVSGPATVGVAVRLKHDWLSGILPGDGVEFTEFAVSSTLTG